MKKPAPLEPELRALLDAEADFPPEDSAFEARVWHKLQTAIVAPPTTGDGGAEPAAGPAALSKYGTVAVIAFLAGGIAGAGLHHLITGARIQHGAQTAPTAAALAVGVDAGVPEGEQRLPLQPPEPAPLAKSEPPLAPVPAPAPAPSASTKASAPSTTNLARERAIIEVARTAVARGRTSAALDAIERHAREFPKGQLVEEREGLRVIALARSGQSEDARKKAAAFRKRYPGSVLLPATEAAVEPKPTEE